MRLIIILIISQFIITTASCNNYRNKNHNSEAAVLYAKGQSFYLRGDTDKALIIFEEIIGSSPDFAYAYLQSGKIHYYNGNCGKAVELIKKALYIKPDDITFLKWLSKSYLLCGDADEALDLLTRAVSLSPEDPSIMILIAKCFKDKQNFSQSIIYYKKAFLFELELAYSHLELSGIYGSFGLTQKMKKELQRGIILGDDKYEK